MTTARAKKPAVMATSKAKAKANSAAATPSRPSRTDDDHDHNDDQLNDAEAEADTMDVDVDDPQEEEQHDDDEEDTTNRQSSTRLRSRVAAPRPATTPAATPKLKSKSTPKPKTTKAKRTTKSTAAATNDSDQDENAAAADFSDEDYDHDHPSSDDDDDKDDDDFETQPKKRTSSRRSTAATPKTTPAAATTFKKPGLPASRAKKAAASTTTPGGRKRGTVVRLNLDTTGLWDAVTTPNVAMSGIVKQWLTEYHVRPSDALLAVVNMIIAATGCTESITPSRFEDQDAVPDYVEELQSHMTTGSTSTSSATAYPLIARTKAHKLHMSAFLSFFTHLITADDDALWDDVLLQVIQQWIAALVSSPLRAFRHTATHLGLHLATTLCTPLANDHHAYHDQVVDTHTALYDTIFVHRYRDVDAAIRKECMRALAAWVERVPDRFLDPTYLRYFGWLLNDQDAGVRTVVLECLAHLYSTPALVPGLRLFTERFKTRIIQIAAADVDPGVQRAGVELACLVYQMGVLSADEVDQVCALVFSKHVQVGTGGVPEALVGVWKEETESMDWPRLIEWVAGLIVGVYPETKVEVVVDAKQNDGSGSDTDDGDDDMGVPIVTQSARTRAISTVTTADPLKCDNALTLLATSLPTLPLFSSPDPALAHLRRTDTSLPHEHLLLALICALATAARDSTGRLLAPHLPALLAKYKADDVAQVYLYRAARAGVPVDAWMAAGAGGTAALDAVLAAGVAAMKRDAAPVVLDEVARLVGALSRRQETQVHVAPVVRRLVSDGCASERPATVVAVVKAVKVPEDVLGGEFRELIEGIEVGSVERVVARLMWLVQLAGVESKVGEGSDEEEDKDVGQDEEGEQKEKEKKRAAAKPTELSAYLRASIHDLIAECVDLLADPESYPARTRVASANVLMEAASIFSGIDLNDRALALLEQLIAARVKSLLMADGQQDLTWQVDAHLNPTLAYLESDHALVRMFSKLVGVGAVDAAYAPTVLQFYRRPPVPAGERADDTGADQPWSVDELARQLTYQADAVVMGEVLEKVPEATLIQVCLSAVQRAFRLSEADKEIVDDDEAEDVKQGETAVGEPDRPGAVPRLAKALADVFKRRKTANVKPVIAYGAQWVLEQFEPVDVPERPALKPKVAKKYKGTKQKQAEKTEGEEDEDADAMEVDKPTADDDLFAKSDAEASNSDVDEHQDGDQEDDAEMQQYESDLADFHVRLNSALRNSAPIVKALKEFVPVLSISDARALYRRFRGSMVLEPLLPALAKKANVKHEPVVMHAHGHGARIVLAAAVAGAGPAPKKRATAARAPKAKRAPAAAGKKTAAKARAKRPQPAKKSKAAWEAVVPGMSSDEEDEDRIEDSDQEDVDAPAAPTPAAKTAKARKRAKPDSDSDEEETPANKSAPVVKGTRLSTRRKAPVAQLTSAVADSDQDQQDEGEQEHEEDEEDEQDPPIKRRKFM